MESIIKELWHGNIVPQEDSWTNSKEMKELLGYMSRHHENLGRSDREKRSEIPVGIFNAKKTNSPRRTESPDSGCGGYFDDTHYKLRGGSRRASIVRSTKRHACTAKEHKAFKNTQKSKWHENVILTSKTNSK